jgi:amidase
MNTRNREGSQVSRRAFLGTCLAGATAAWGSTFLALGDSGGAADPNYVSWVQLFQQMMESGQLTSRTLTQAYLQRIKQLNPLLAAVLEPNPDALSLAASMDQERLHGQVRGPLHGIPVLLKDNVATLDGMKTTAGSLALVESRVARDATLVTRLRAAGAVILGKANMSEWANFRGFAPFNGWSARGGFTRNPYDLGSDPGGSSSGSAVGVAANLVPLAVGTETFGSILDPAAVNLVVGLRPTWGLVAQDGIVPIARSLDTAGPLATTVTDAAILLAALQSPTSVVAGPVPADYLPYLQRGALRGSRIGLDQRFFTPEYGAKPHLLPSVREALYVIRDLGATFVATDTGDPFQYANSLSTVMLNEFKANIGEYLGDLAVSPVRNLTQLIAFNRAVCSQEMKYFGQELFEKAESTTGNLRALSYLLARATCTQRARTLGIDAALQRDNLDAILAPGSSYAAIAPSAAGYPSLSLPIGLTPEGRPAALWLYGGFLSEPKLLALAFDLEQEIKPRRQPQYLGSVPPEPPDAGLCGSAVAATARAASLNPKNLRDTIVNRLSGFPC